MSKKCKVCGKEKQSFDFCVHKNNRDGLMTICKSCRNSQRRDQYRKDPGILESIREWRNSNIEKKRAADRKWSIANTEKNRASSRRFYKNHKDSVLAENKIRYENKKSEVLVINKKWALSNPEKVKKIKQRWKERHPEKVQEMDRNRRAIKKYNGGEITAKEWQTLKEKYNFTCICCLRREPEIKLTLDHVFPLFLGGKHVIENAQPLCLSCNSRKSIKHIDYRLKWFGVI